MQNEMTFLAVLRQINTSLQQIAKELSLIREASGK